MGKIVANFFISLDGVVEAPDQWHFPYFDEAMGAVIGEGMQGQTGFLMGRRLYDDWSQYWPANTDDGFGPYINSIPKYVLTSRPVDGELWTNTTVIGGSSEADTVGQVRALKERDGDVGMSGSATTVRWLLANGLLDELNLLIHPIAVGKGQRLFEQTGTVPLRTEHTATLPSGVLHVRYAPA